MWTGRYLSRAPSEKSGRVHIDRAGTLTWILADRGHPVARKAGAKLRNRPLLACHRFAFNEVLGCQRLVIVGTPVWGDLFNAAPRAAHLFQRRPLGAKIGRGVIIHATTRHSILQPQTYAVRDGAGDAPTATQPERPRFCRRFAPEENRGFQKQDRETEHCLLQVLPSC